MSVNPNATPEPSARDVVAALLRALPLAVAAALVVGIVAFWALGKLPNRYGSTAVLVIDPVPDSGHGATPALEPTALDVEAYMTVVTGGQVTDMVIEELGGEERLETATIEVSAPGAVTSRLVIIQVEDGSPTSAAEIANAYAQALITWDSTRLRQELESRATALRAQLEEVMARAEFTSGPEGDALSSLASSLRGEIALVATGAVSPVPALRVLEPARPDPEPVSPRPKLYGAVAAAAAFAMVFGIGLLRLAFDDRLRSTAAAMAASGLPVLVELPQLRREPGPYLRALALLAAQVRRPVKPGADTTLLLTSASDDDAKSLVAVTLAAWFANDDVHTLLVDTDSERPRATSLLKLKSGPGFDEYLRKPHDTSLGPVTVKVGRHTALRVVPNHGSGTEPSVVSSESLAAVVERLKAGAEVLVLDAAPTYRSPDAMALAPHSTAVGIVVALNVTTGEELRRTVEMLKRAGIEPLGLVVWQGTPRRLLSFTPRRVAWPPIALEPVGHP